ncbi:tRNA (guanine(10)-N(2))-dimethyltransferase [Methanoplanus endosymbiosus]|uniref:tRNA (guanine(26)-N(2))-dimethyltransferase n=1 Tax=Methanoplanus endosymbiosus TaxID=33865 RepID=A0A9E7PMD9_9EURY|nr:tRNA (guanine(10)-N(2))-dimethyltransferase [Methanoplanus endosymbiosus]UUX91997.1 tRNA (guanine(10)-N(2))-dimethyltransferase [Methanoplanus endosymbiosus]
MDLVEVTEGTTRFLVPKQDDTEKFPPGTAPVFFNRRMEINRDITVLLMKCLSPVTYLDAMGATGVRGFRAAHECGIETTINEKDSDAVALLKYNSETYCRNIEVVHSDAKVIMNERRFDAVDVDPFGSPAPFLDSASGSAKRFLFATATDTAPLCGAHLKAGIRRYAARPLNTDYHSEVGLRILLGYALREAAKYDRGIEPLFSFAREHFVRIHLKMTNGAGRADKALENLGYIHQCPKCPYREEEHAVLPERRTCPDCGAKLTPAGPLWLGAVSDTETIRQMAEILPETELGAKNRIEKLLDTCLNELPTSTFYDYHRLAKTWRVSPKAIDLVIEELKNSGWKASRVHYAGTGIKTDAPLKEIKEILCQG